MKDDDILKNNTRLKLVETKNFLDEIKVAYSEFIDNDTISNFIILRGKFSAFISAARSITSFMRKQYSQVPGFLEWYELKKYEMSQDQELFYMNKARVENIHIGVVPLGMVNEVKFSISCEIVSQEEARRRMENMSSKEPVEIDGPEPANPTTPSKTVELFLPKEVILDRKIVRMNDNINLIAFCENQFNKLKDLVDECEYKFLRK
ncbi:MAG: hypothetical protein IPI63_04690 [Methanothrix sp.]|uniref:hypothetical protein n=1 Tax=Methanothrix sp. TaxID=90426 RepID=UPI0025D76C13|nr:hypothetical protein [Methanothrix sp.]MBK7386044.1 hypothetical protein [Methanothrix sp.]